MWRKYSALSLKSEFSFLLSIHPISHLLGLFSLPFLHFQWPPSLSHFSAQPNIHHKFRKATKAFPEALFNPFIFPPSLLFGPDVTSRAI